MSDEIKDLFPDQKPTNELNKKNVGEYAYELLTKVEASTTPIDQMRECLTDYEKGVYECYDRGKAANDGDFFIVVITKKERLMENVLRNYFAFRKTCPTPDYDQTVYRYSKEDDSLKYLWTIPAHDICRYLVDHALELDSDSMELLRFVMDFNDGSLLKSAKKFNGEVEDSTLLKI